ncbi:radical SAM protein [bacterium (Candidatus Blackallbacteria) CG17_big_fil_post_rev_8_21_14_2_50_48_46]|uniref:Radical SAM protein n=1 Tax=bacterium (Candidatus Blackallbacteria) CG17_big_fil_post_rev_8_21_14_2_50_48_46 TaxID=2014261 RepID=A0A2M7G8I7_9BACT|nr:MAG: hypothetical protein COW64_05165 [bacterium (Candidatus Blackallbacteria) CG18_big_fil_WC_8_21_14_2_50_49_26]PIW18420.1 MAG: radical SAM protein [bacterium (Candidatus Blackallbacteria) CG17_big_fil_post_rev_8_21_14_2_50_48_46]PIW46595.1 MAG: radical SAM protein [bacterium (Candidatus Blackallbacteria) CG13_big_fil_rev_8_21_14_2_50_49_14]
MNQTFLKQHSSGFQFKLHPKNTGYSISLGPDTVYSFDPEDRLIWVYQSGTGYQRGLSGAVLAKTRNSQGKKRWLLNLEEQARLFQKVLADLNTLHALIEPHEQAVIEKLLAKNGEALASESLSFQAIYRPISILPPDQYSAIVVQAAEGCSWNRCHFCNFYKDRRFRIKSETEFIEHLQAVSNYLGKSALTRKGLFLADGDALMIPQPHLLKLIADMQQVFPGRPWYSFMDAFRPQAKQISDYQRLAETGLKRVYLGIESGYGPLLSLLNKPGDPELMLTEVLRLKEAGLQVGLILMIGIGGRQMAAEHLSESLKFLDALPLDKGDIVYLSEFIEHPDQPYHQQALEQGITPLSEQEIQTQIQAFKQGLRHSLAQVSPYHLMEYIY